MPKTKKQATAGAADEAAPVDMQEVKNQLVAQAKKAGHIDQREITTAIPETPENADVLDSLYTDLADAGVDVTTGTAEEDVPAISEEALSDEWALEDGEEAIVEDQHYLDDIADDSVRLYLREIGKIPLLSAEELELAHRVVAGDKEAKDKMAEANMRLVVSIAKRYVGRGMDYWT